MWAGSWVTAGLMGGYAAVEAMGLTAQAARSVRKPCTTGVYVAAEMVPSCHGLLWASLQRHLHVERIRGGGEAAQQTRAELLAKALVKLLTLPTRRGGRGVVRGGAAACA